MAKEITREMFEEYLEYDPESPSGLRWKVDVYTGKNSRILRKKAGEIAGSVRKHSKTDGYLWWVIQLNKVGYNAHRVVYCLVNGVLEAKLHIDHIDGNPLNNKIENLRTVTQKVNRKNSKKSILNNSGVVGVRIQTRANTDYTYIIAFWHENDKQTTKCFSVKKLGYDLAFELACKCREEAIARLNENGHGYTERHGQ